MALTVTAQQVIDQSLKLIGVLGDGTSITATEYDDCLLTLNLMLDRWNLQDVMVYTINSHSFPFVMGQQSYTLGLTGDFDIERPAVINKISIQYPSTSGSPIEIPLDANFDLEAWQKLCVKNIESAFPVACYNNTGYPFMTLNFWPIPNSPANVILYSQDLLPNIAALTDTILLPTGYSDAIIYNLAVRLAQMFDRVPSPELQAEAKLAKRDIANINRSAPTLHMDPLFSKGSSGSIATKTFGQVVL